MKFFKSSSAEDAGADNDSSEDSVVGCTTTTDDDLKDEADHLLDVTNQISEDVDDGYFDKVDFVKLIGKGLLDFRENFNVTTAATCKVSEFIMDILRIERKLFAKAIEESLLRKSHLTAICLILKLKKYCIQKVPLFKLVQNFARKRVCKPLQVTKKLYRTCRKSGWF